jgi:hypothetical protein
MIRWKTSGEKDGCLFQGADPPEWGDVLDVFGRLKTEQIIHSLTLMNGRSNKEVSVI